MSAKTPGSEPLPPSPNEAILVRMGEWKEGQGDVVLETHNLNACIGLAMYEPESKTGFLLHDPLPQEHDSEYNWLEDRLRVVFKDQPGAFGRMKVWLSGGSTALADAIQSGAGQFVAGNKDFMVESMELIGIPKESVEISWTPEGYIKSDMVLDCATGTCTVTHHQLPPA